MNYTTTSAGLARLLVIFIALPVIFLSSCTVNKGVPYFRDIPDSLSAPAVRAHQKFSEPRIQSDDLLSVSISTIDAVQSTGAATTGGGATSGASVTSITPTYLVDKNGNIDLPIVGRVNVANLTTTEVKDLLYTKAQKYYVNPIVNVRFANFNITILGEVNRPGTYTMANEKVTLLDAIGQASDLTITGRRDNILIVREENGSKTFVRLNLNSTDVLRSPYFYLHSGDAIYVEPIKAKINSSTTDSTKDRYLPYIFSGLSLLFTVANIIIQLNNQK